MTRIPFKLFVGPLLLSLVGACAGTSDEDARSTPSALVSRTAPQRTDFTTTYAAGMSADGWAYFPYDQTDAAKAHDLTFSDGYDTAAAPTAYTDLATWIPIARGGTNADYESTPALATHLASAIARSDADLGKIDKSSLDSLASTLNTLFAAGVTVDPVTTRKLGYTPVQARWLRSKYVQQSNGNYRKYDYPDPTAVAEIRERGARLYCSARRAMREQALHPESTMLGEQVALPLTIFGKKIDIGVVQASLTIDGPQRYTGAPIGSPQPNDGAQAFEIPLLAGARVIPIRGIAKFLEAFPELRHPIVLTTGDSEVVSGLPAQSMRIGSFPFCNPTCVNIPFFKTDNPAVYQTATHADAISSSSSALRWSTTFPLFSLSLMTVKMQLGADLVLGQPAADYNDRLFDPSTTYASWPASGTSPPIAGRGSATSPVSAFAYFDDSLWKKTSGYPTYANYPLGVQTAAGTTLTLPVADPLQVRAGANDDHHVATRTGLGLNAKLIVNGGVSVGPLQLDLIVDGSIGGRFDLEHHVRDGIGVYGMVGGATAIPANALTNVTVTPATSSTVSFAANVGLHIALNLPIGGYEDTIDLFGYSTSKTYGGTPWAENRRLRIGTGGSTGDATNQPGTLSHIASTSTPVLYDAFASQTVDACLADTTPNPTPPAPCKANDGPVTTPSANVCVYSGPYTAGGIAPIGPFGFGTAAQWGSACTNPASTAAAIAGSTTSPMYPCYRDFLAYLCSPVSRVLDASNARSHILEAGTADARLANVITTCVNANPSRPAKDTIRSLMSFGVCDGTARLLSKDEIISVSSGKGASTPEDVSDVPNCH